MKPFRRLPARSAAPILVTGVPRSGTTWLARLLAKAPGTALAGREPMNPRGRQYKLAGTLDGWAKLEELTPKQARALRTAYRGLNPWVYSRYGHRQWAAPLPGIRLIMKDPFAVLSIPAVQRVTGAHPVLLFRHPGAVLASYRRMGWEPDLDELRPIAAHHATQHPRSAEVMSALESADMTSAQAMGRFWSVLHQIALDDLPSTNATIVAHSDVAGYGLHMGPRLFRALGLEWTQESAAEFGGDGHESNGSMDQGTGQHAGSTLHDFDRPPAAVADAWRSSLRPGELSEIEDVAADVLTRLNELRLQRQD